jgi:2-keto-4-pentenoate hydratase/2-oxohepta-3-ene-1,7-dioic acid hydratase in catechol pathway
MTAAVAGEIRLGAVVGGSFVDIVRVDPSLPRTLVELIAAGESALAAARRAVVRVSELVESTQLPYGLVVPIDQVVVLSPIPRPKRNVFCVGRNYLRHAAEGARARGEEFKPPEYPEFFTKPPEAVVGTESKFTLSDSVTGKLDYEIELAIVIGKHGRDISRESASEHVFGYTLANDLSARDQQRRHGQWFRGKALDGSCPLGPVVVPHKDLDPAAISLQLRVNGETRQSTSTGDMTWGIADVVHWLSQGTSLEPGDVILTGTPEGVGNAMRPPTYLAPGDVVEAAADGIGLLRTHIVGSVT